MRDSCCFTFALLLSLAGTLSSRPLAAQSPPSSPERPPNVILIFVDDLGSGDLGCQGSREAITPHIDSIAAQGIRFTSGYVTAPQCGPSRAGLMTGIYQQRFGFEGNPEHKFLRQFGLPRELRTFADRLGAVGLKTAGFGKWDLGAIPESQPWNRGFNEYLGFYTGSRPFWPVSDENVNSYTRLRNSPDQLVPESGHMTTTLTKAATEYIRKSQNTPFFLYLSYNAPHWPMEPTPESLKLFEQIPDRHRRHFLALLHGVDQGVGEVLTTLKELKLDENTLLIFLSDNGGPTGKPRISPDAEFAYGQNTSLNTPFRGVKGDVYEGGIRVPFLMRWSGTFPAGQVVETPVSSLDLIPTALAAVNRSSEITPDLDGVNLLPYLTGENSAPPHGVLYWRWLGKMAIREGDWKLVRLPQQPLQLFNLKSDPGETINLADPNPERVRSLEEKLMKWSAQMVEPKWRKPKQLEMIRKAYQ